MTWDLRNKNEQKIAFNLSMNVFGTVQALPFQDFLKLKKIFYWLAKVFSIFYSIWQYFAILFLFAYNGVLMTST